MTTTRPNLDRRPRRHADAAFRSVGDEGGLVVLPGRAEVKVLNPAAIKIFSLLDGEHTAEQIAGEVHDEFDVSAEQALSDVREFVEELERHGMLSADDPSSPPQESS